MSTPNDRRVKRAHPPKPRPKRGAPPTHNATSPARELATRLLSRVLLDFKTLDEAEAAEAVRVAALSRPDRAFARRLALETLRRLGAVDALIDAELEHDLPAEAERIRQILRIAAAEMAFMETPPHAAVGEAVSLAKRATPRFAGLVNAIGRRIAENAPRATIPSAIDAAPRWLADALTADWGAETAGLIMESCARPAPLDLTPKSPKKAEALAQVLGAVVTPTGSVRLSAKPGQISAMTGYGDGLWWVQDAAAAIPARLLEVRPGERVLDLCAAPGGKTLQLAAAEADVVALDSSAERMKRVDENLKRTKLTARLVVADATVWRPKDGALFDAVLLDAPCTATGTLRRHPELPHIRDLSALPALIAAQDALLDAAWALVKPGGRLVFCTCSLLRAEGEDRLEAALTRWDDAETPPLAPELVGLSARAAADPAASSAAAADAPPFRPESIAQRADLARGRFRSTPAAWPRHGGVDGFFAARVRKRAIVKGG